MTIQERDELFTKARGILQIIKTDYPSVEALTELTYGSKGCGYDFGCRNCPLHQTVLEELFGIDAGCDIRFHAKCERNRRKETQSIKHILALYKSLFVKEALLDIRKEL